jgi:uncharacterized protein YhaN
VRIDRIEIDAFGPLAGFHAANLAGQPVLVVHGENEAGKTCLRDFLSTLLYGFAGTSREQHPWTPWSGATPEGRASFKMQDGRALKVERRMRERPEASIACEDAPATELGNRPLPATGPVDRALFEDVHAPGQGAPEGLSEAAWSAVRERLLSGLAAPHLRSAREAAAALEARAAELWQPGRRARTRHRALSVRIRRLTRERDRAAAQLRRLLELRELIAGRSWHLKGMEEQLAETRTRLLRADRLLPVLRAMQHAAELRRASRKAVPNDDFGDDPAGALAAVRAATQQAEERVRAMRTEFAGHEARMRLGPEETTLLAAEQEIRDLVAEIPAHQQDVVHVNDLARERDAQEALFRDRGSHVFATTPDGAGREALARLGFGELRDRVSAWEEAARGPEAARQELRQAKEQLRVCELDFEAVPSADAERKLRAKEELLRQLQAREDTLAALKKDVVAEKAAREAAEKKRIVKPRGHKAQAIGFFAATVCTLSTLLLGAMKAWWMVVPMALICAWNGWKSLRHRDQIEVLAAEKRAEDVHQECLKLREQLGLHEVEALQLPLDKAREALAHVAARPELERRLVGSRRRTEECTRAVQIREQERDKARDHVAEWMGSLALLPERLQQPDQDLLHDINELRDILRVMTRLSGERETIVQRAREREARAASVAEKLDVVSPRSPMDAATIWFERLHLAQAAKRRADESARALPELRERLAELAGAVQAAQAGQRQAEERLGALDASGKAEAGLRVLAAARAALLEADEVEAAMHRQIPDWQERAEEARAAERAGETLELSAAQRVALEGQITQLQAAMEKARGELAELDGEREALLRCRPLSDVDGELAALAADRTHVERVRDRLMALAALVRLADERWRARWQAPVLKAASENLAAMTGGRWDRLDAESDGESTRLFVKRFDGEGLRELSEPLSRAVRGQAWLALRVALAEQLDGDEPLPLVLDDPFGGWDLARVKAAAAMLSMIGTRRQVIVLTGRAEIAEAFETLLKARVLHLPAPAAPHKSRRKEKDEAHPERVEKSERVEKTERVEKAERAEKTGRFEKAERVEKADRPEKTDAVVKTDVVDRPDAVVTMDVIEKADAVAKPDRVEKVERAEKVERSEKTDHPEKVERVEKTELPVKSEQPEPVAEPPKGEEQPQPKV